MLHRHALRLVPVLCLLALTALGAPHRFIIDDDAYSDQVLAASARLLRAGKLVSTESLRDQVQTHGCPLKLAKPWHRRLDPPDLCERLRQSTLALSSYYKCPDCGQWHLSSSAGFVVGSEGIVCTCCHVVLGEDDQVTECYLVASDAVGHVFPVRSVLAADPESDTCFLKIDASGLKPLPLRPGIRTGEQVYCLSHPGGFYYMFTQGIVARLNLKCNEMFDEHGQTNGLLSRPILFLNVTTEFAPGSSGAPVVDTAGNVVGQVASITEAGEPPDESDTNAPPSPSVPVRFCTAAEEMLHLTDPHLKPSPELQTPKPDAKPQPHVKKLKPQ